MDLTLFAFAFLVFNICSGQRHGKIYIDNEGNPQCPCARILFPVCGTDGKTYNNKCYLECQQYVNSNLHMKHEGECRSKRNYDQSYQMNFNKAQRRKVSVF